MIKRIGRDDVQRLVADGAQLVEVLRAAEYDDEHLPAAINVPLTEFGARADELDRDRPVIVYCYDYT